MGLKKSAVKTFVSLISVLALVILWGNFIAYGGWNPKPPTAPTDNPVQPINIGALGQIKTAQLELNSEAGNPGTAPIGLIVFGASNFTGKVSIGTTQPTEKLDMTDNLRIDDGLLKVNNVYGYPWGSVLRRTATGMQWWNPVGWLTLSGDYKGGSDCELANPAPNCTDLGYQTYLSDICVTDGLFSYFTNICYKP